jgi:hypothetical protein
MKHKENINALKKFEKNEIPAKIIQNEARFNINRDEVIAKGESEILSIKQQKKAILQQKDSLERQ